MAVVAAVAMLVTTVVTGTALAVDSGATSTGSDTVTSQVDNSDANSTEQSEGVDTDDATSSEADADNAVSADAESDESQNDAANSASDEENADTSADGEDAEADSEDLVYTASMPLSEDEDSDDELTVTATVPQGAFSEDVTLEVAPVEDTDTVSSELDDADIEYGGFAAVDVRFVTADGVEVEPSEPVDVSFEFPGSVLGDVDASTIAVHHFVEDADGTVSSVETVADADNELGGTVSLDGGVTALSADSDDAVDADSTVTVEFTVDSFSTFTITWGNDWSTYFRVTVHYVDESGKDIDGTQAWPVSIANGNEVFFGEYAGEINNYTYSGAYYGPISDGKVITRMVASQSGRYYVTRYLTFYNGNTRVDQLTRSSSDYSVQEADVYLVYTKDSSTGGGDEGDGGTGGDTGSTTDATVTTSKTAVLKNDDSGNYDLTLSITGDRGSSTSKQAVDIVFVLDKSGSMDRRLYDDYDAGQNEESRMDLLQEAVGELIDTVEGNDGIDVQYSAVGFSGNGTSNHGRTTTQSWTDSKDIIENYVNGLDPDGGTNYQRAIYEAKRLLQSKREGALTFVVFVSDGIPTYRGTTSDSGSGSNDNNGENIEAAVDEIRSMTCDYFYAIGMGPEFTSGGTGMTNLTSLANAVNATTTGVYSATNTDDLETAFGDITGSITFFAASNVTISDPLSEYADMVLDANDNPQFTITVTNGTQTWTSVAGMNTLTFKNASGGDVTLTASYDEGSRTITLDFPDDYELEEGYTYSVSAVIEPSGEANSAGEDRYNGTGETGTGTHAGENGFYSNGDAEVTYTANGESGSTAFPKPVIQVQDQPSIVVALPMTGGDSTALTLLLSGGTLGLLGVGAWLLARRRQLRV